MIKLLLDANLSYRLVKKIEDKYTDCIHVTNTNLDTLAKDIDIWNWAKNNQYTIVTNDEDFENFLNYLQFPPKIILLKTGNQATSYIATILLESFHEIQNFANSKDEGLLEIF
jgi:predicted nuclease of predicted toxin-antitoxin system